MPPRGAAEGKPHRRLRRRDGGRLRAQRSGAGPHRRVHRHGNLARHPLRPAEPPLRPHRALRDDQHLMLILAGRGPSRGERTAAGRVRRGARGGGQRRPRLGGLGHRERKRDACRGWPVEGLRCRRRRFRARRGLRSPGAAAARGRQGIRRRDPRRHFGLGDGPRRPRGGSHGAEPARADGRDRGSARRCRRQRRRARLRRDTRHGDAARRPHRGRRARSPPEGRRAAAHSRRVEGELRPHRRGGGGDGSRAADPRPEGRSFAEPAAGRRTQPRHTLGSGAQARRRRAA